MATLDQDRAEPSRLTTGAASLWRRIAPNGASKPVAPTGGLRRIVEVLLLILLGVASARFFWLMFAPLPIADAPPPVVRPVAQAPGASADVVRSPFGRVEEIAAAKSETLRLARLR
ncbi:MAG: hypothetical protein AAGJ87_08465, partial [Pseudomonadota bacterium]